MTDSDEKTIRALGNIAWAQLDWIFQDWYAYVDRHADRLLADEDGRVLAVRHYCGDDIADMYQEWLDESD